MIPIDPIGLLFLGLETPERAASMCGVAIYDPPHRGGDGFGQKVLRAFRAAAVQPPFERRPTWIRHGLPAWEIVEPDLSHHVRHVALPPPGSLNQLLELVGTLYAPLLDRNLPLWECYVIEGLKEGRLGILLKVHHALLDGMGTMRLLRESHSESRHDSHLRPIWGQLPRGARGAAQQRRDRRELTAPGSSPAAGTGMLAKLTDAAGAVVAMGRGALGASAPLALRATPNALNATVRSSVRSYAGFALPLARVKAVGQALGATVNDVVLSPRTLCLGGARLVGFLGTPIVPAGAGLNVTLLSYDGNLWFSIGATPEAVPDAPALARCIEAAFADLRAAVA